MSDYIDRCLDEGLKPIDEYYEVIETTEDGCTIAISECDPEVCVHEAGHAVVGYLQGRRLKHVYAAPFDEEVWNAFHKEYFTQHLAGQVAYEDDDHPYPLDGDDAAQAQWLKDEMLSMMGAGVAVCHFIGGGEPAKALSDTDQSAIYGNWLLEYCNLIGAFENPPFDMPDEPTEAQEEQWLEWIEAQEDAVEAGLWAEVEHILLTHWHLVEGLAAVLTANPYLDGPEVYEVFDRIKARRAAAA
jgi:hypothetical protein